MRIFSSLFIVFLAIMTSCEQEASELSTDNFSVELEGFWRLQSGILLENNDPITENINPLAYLIFEPDNEVRGNSSRNQLQGTYIAEAESINLELSNLTEVAETEWSEQFLRKTQASTSYQLSGDSLLLRAPGRTLDLLFFRLSDSTCVDAITDSNRFSEARSDEFDLLDVKLIDQCLEVYVGYGGGCKAVNMELVSSEAYGESLPPQLDVRLIFEDDDFCEAYLKRRFYFDLTPLQAVGSDALSLSLEGWDERILVQYE